MSSIPGYKVKRKLGSGGMADVYLATQESFGRDVAIKVLSSEAANDKDFGARFLREANIVAGLSHPHIVPVYDVGQSSDFFYMSMDYLSGGDLDQWIKAGIPEDEILHITEQIAEALHYAHYKGYIHRDIKPGNIMFREDNSAVLTDFGIARLQNADDQITQAGTIIGTPRYMSPEVLKGKEPDSRADIYALGIVFYEMLMKKVPYQAKEYTAVALMHVQDPIPTLPGPYAKYQDFLNKILAKNPDQRFQSGRNIIKAIKQLQQKTKPDVGSNIIEKTKVMSAEEIEQLSNNGSDTPSSSISGEIEDHVSFDEKIERKAGLFKKYILLCNVQASDPRSIAFLFSKVTTQILDWYKRRGTKAIRVEFYFVSNSWCFNYIDKTVMDLYKSEGVFEFLNGIEMIVNMNSIDGTTSEQFTINQKGEKIVTT